MAESPAMPPTRPFWTAYFCLACLAWLFGLVFGDHSPIDLLNSALFGMGLVGLWGYINDLRIGWRLFWVAFFVFSSAAVGYLLLVLLAEPAMRGDSEAWIILAVGVALAFPQWLAWWRYAFRSPHLWAASDVA